jgi:peptidoglycan hydrolase-like protein with peptidoglycan-binding domain
MPTQQLTGSVGLGGVNSPTDVNKVQTLLKSKGVYRGSVDNICNSKTIAAIKKFQAHFMRMPDGRVDPNGITWEKLTEQLPMGLALSTQSADTAIPGFSFPFSFIPPSWREAPRAFGVSRSGGRKHAGCDLYAPTSGTPIYAVADGVLVRNSYPFYDGTDALEVIHGNLLVRYGEIKPGSFTGTIKKGQKLAEVGRLSTYPQPMLHIEIYTNTASNASLTDATRVPYKRRADLTDPTPYLDEWINNLPQP